MAQERYAELKRILEERRREILERSPGEDARRARGRRVRRRQGVLDAAETSEADIQDDIEFALIQMKSETLHKIEEALARLEEGTYGNCFECGDEISERRLRALPFAVRCKDCEEAREIAEQRERQLSQRRFGRVPARFELTSGVPSHQSRGSAEAGPARCTSRLPPASNGRCRDSRRPARRLASHRRRLSVRGRTS